MKKKKVNPRRRPISAEVSTGRAKTMAIRTAWAIMLTVLRDKEGYDVDGLCRVWQEVDDLSDSIAKGYVRVDDLRAVLRDEAGISLD